MHGVPARLTRPPFRVLLVDDHEMLLQGLAHALGDEPDIDIAGHARDE